MYFQVRDISKEGLQLHTSLRNKYLIPGMNLQTTVALPMGSSVQMRVEIVRIGIVSIGGKDRLSVGVEYRGLTQHARRQLGQYLAAC